MPLPPFHGDTFVAFADISGFKQMLEKKPEEAIKALGRFYAAAYRILDKPGGRAPIHGLLISDCAVLFVDDSSATPGVALESLLSAVKKLNKQSLDHGLMLTTAIAYGPFHYEQRIEFTGIEKNLLTGSAYVSAYKDSCARYPRLRCGDCRIVAENLPPEAMASLEQRQGAIYSMTKRTKPGHFYYYWMRKHPDEIQTFESAFGDVENLKFQAIRLLLRGSSALEVRNLTN